jgi:hypothetical protein
VEGRFGGKWFVWVWGILVLGEGVPPERLLVGVGLGVQGRRICAWSPNWTELRLSGGDWWASVEVAPPPNPR